MQDPKDSAPAPNQPPRAKLLWWLIPTVVLSALALAVSTILPSRWKPNLEVKNTGTNAVTFSFKDGTFVTPPGESWRNSFYAGDTLTVRASQPADASAQTIKLPERNPKAWTLQSIAQRWTAEVNADDPKNIRFENRRWEEITAPQQPSQPWP